MKDNFFKLSQMFTQVSYLPFNNPAFPINLRCPLYLTLFRGFESGEQPICFRKSTARVGLKLNIQKTKIMASGPITSWQIDTDTMETVIDFIFLGSRITVDDDCSHEIKTLAPWKESYDQPR